MNMTELRLEGELSALEVLSEAIGLEGRIMWKEGESGRDGKKYLSSGLMIEIAETSKPSTMIEEIRKFVTRCDTLGLSFNNVRAQISVGVTVGDSKQYMANFEFNEDDLKTLGKLGLALSVSCYPTSDEANDHEAL